MAQKLTIEHFRQSAGLRPFQSMLEVTDQEEGYVYRLVENTPEAIRYRQKLGYEVVVEGPASVKGSIGQPDRRKIIAGELILMRRSLELHKLDVKAREERAQDMMRGPIESFKAKAHRLGVKVVDESRIEVSPLASKMGANAEEED